MTDAPRYVHDIPVRPRQAPRAAAARLCAVQGCLDAGEYRAPLSPDKLEVYQWLCLTHVREHNSRWDYFRGMSAADIERYIHDNAVGHRPTWSLGHKTAGQRRAFSSIFRDPFRVFEDGPTYDRGSEPSPGPNRTRLQRAALEALHLDETASLIEVKARYKELVKRYHPDANGGDRSSEERLKQVIRAYRTLRASSFA